MACLRPTRRAAESSVGSIVVERSAADRLEQAIAAVISEGESVTYDMKPSRDDPTAVGTSEVADAVIGKLETEVHA